MSVINHLPSPRSLFNALETQASAIGQLVDTVAAGRQGVGYDYARRKNDYERDQYVGRHCRDDSDGYSHGYGTRGSSNDGNWGYPTYTGGHARANDYGHGHGHSHGQAAGGFWGGQAGLDGCEFDRSGNSTHGSHGSHGGQGPHGAHGGFGHQGAGQSSVVRGDLTAKMDGSSGVVKTPGGYTIRSTSAAENVGGAVEITSPTGVTTVIEKDPHVKVDADGKGPGGMKAAFDFKGNMSVLLPDGTKIDLATKPGPNNTTVLDRATVVPGNGTNGVLMSNLSSGDNKLTMNVGRKDLVDRLVQGTQVYWNANKDAAWTADNGIGGFDQVVTQSWADTHLA